MTLLGPGYERNARGALGKNSLNDPASCRGMKERINDQCPGAVAGPCSLSGYESEFARDEYGVSYMTLLVVGVWKIEKH